MPHSPELTPIQQSSPEQATHTDAELKQFGDDVMSIGRNIGLELVTPETAATMAPLYETSLVASSADIETEEDRRMAAKMRARTGAQQPREPIAIDHMAETGMNPRWVAAEQARRSEEKAA